MKDVVPTPVQAVPMPKVAVTPKTVKEDIDGLPTPEKWRATLEAEKPEAHTLQLMREAGSKSKEPIVDAQVSIPKRGRKIEGKYTNEQYQKYLAASKLIEEQKKKKKALGGK